MSTTTSPVRGATAQSIGSLKIVPFLHPQGCRTYLIGDPDSGQSLALDVHLDLVKDVADRVRAEGWSLPYVVDTHTHADHPSGAGDLAPQFGSTRIAHKAAHHRGVARHPDDGDRLHLGDQVVTIRHAPGHTPDHLVLLTDGALFSGDTLFIGGVARTDFLGGDAGQLHDTIHALIADLPDETVVYPGHDYEGRTSTSLGNERANNPWLRLSDRSAFVKALTANPPPRPANMDDLLRLNREGVKIPDRIDAATVAERVRQGGATSVVDVRMGAEYESEHIPGSRLIPLDQIEQRLDEVASTLSALEIEDLVTVRDVAVVAQRLEMVTRIAREIEDYVLELGTDGRLLALQLEELVTGVDAERELVIRDYLPGGRRAKSKESALERLEALSPIELVDAGAVARALGIGTGEHLDGAVAPRGFRLLAKVPRLPPAVVDRLVEHFGTLQKLLSAGIDDLQAVDGVGELRARSVREGLSRLAESSILERYV